MCRYMQSATKHDAQPNHHGMQGVTVWVTGETMIHASDVKALRCQFVA